MENYTRYYANTNVVCNYKTTMKHFRFLGIFIFFSTLTSALFAQDKQPLLTKQQAIEDFNWLRFSLEYVHPRLYKYEDKKTVDARFDSLSSLIGNEITGIDFLSLVSKMNASVRCGHLYTIPQNELEKEVLEKKVLPFYVKLINNKIYIVNNCGNNSISNGSEILSVNGKSSTEILSTILTGVSADGFIQTRKLRLIERYFFYNFNGFDYYYHLLVDRSDSFQVEYIDFKTKTKGINKLNGISINERQNTLLSRYKIDESKWFKTPSPIFEIDKPKNYAKLTISRSFFNDKVDPNFDSLLAKAFSRLKKEKISNLIIDLRDNEGGSEHQEAELMSYLYNKPFKLYQNIYVSRLDYRPLKSVIFASEKDTTRLLDKNEDEWMRKISDNLWINNYEYYEGLQLQPAKKDVFQGNLYIIINGTCFSSTSALIANIKNTTKAVFIGEESGGLYEGPTGGQTIPIILPNSKIMIRISPNINLGFMYQKHSFGRGVLPDYPINYTITDILDNKDLEFEQAKTIIAKKK
jgi:Peptidase family S41